MRATEIAEITVEMLTTVTRDGAPFTIDMRLRPEGASAPLCPPLSRYEHYYGARGQMWEFQSFMKIRPVAGDAALGEKFMRRCAAPIAERIAALGPDGVALSMVGMRRQIEESVKTPRWVLCDFQKGPGGLVDLDFLAQYWQLLNLEHEPELIGERPERIFERMAEHGILNAAEAESMRSDYRFLRRLESRARLLMNSDKTQAPGGGEKWESFARMACDLLPSSESDLRRYLLDTLRRNRARFDKYLSPSID